MGFYLTCQTCTDYKSKSCKVGGRGDGEWGVGGGGLGEDSCPNGPVETKLIKPEDIGILLDTLNNNFLALV